jgi:hypothetical protein
MLPRHACDDAAEVGCRCQVILETMLLSHASDGAVEATCPRRDVDTESCCDGGTRVTWSRHDVDVESCRR